MTTEQIQYLKSFWNEVKQAAGKLEQVSMPELKLEEFNLFFTTGNRLIYEKAYFGRRKYLTVYGILAVYGKKQEHLEKLAHVIRSVCEERFWALPAHVNGEARDELTIDLFAAETAQTLSELVFLLYDKLPEEVIQRVFLEVQRRVLVPFLSSEVPYSWWEKDRCNWSAVCAGSIGMTAIYMSRMQQLLDEKKEICIRRVCDALDCYLDGMEEDGACTEGLGYYAYGMSYYTAFAELLYQETNGMVNLMKKPKCENIALFQQKCYFGGGISVSFSDGSRQEPFLPGLTAYLAHCFGKVETPDYGLARGLEGDACYRWLTNERNIRWLMTYGRQCTQADKSLSNLLPCAQWMIGKDAKGNGFAAKGGHNAESHNHNDIGHFLCVFQGEMLLTDLGAGEYTKDYFGTGRYDILCNRSLGHSVPIINGMEQAAGREYQATEFVWNDEAKELTISFGAAYPKNCIRDIVRKIHMEEEENLSLYITDTFIPTEQTQEIVENLITTYKPLVDNHHIFIKGVKGGCCIKLEGLVIKDSLVIIPKKHRNHAGIEETVYLIQWKIPVRKEEKSECRMCIMCQKETDNT